MPEILLLDLLGKTAELSNARGRWPHPTSPPTPGLNQDPVETSEVQKPPWKQPLGMPRVYLGANDWWGNSSPGWRLLQDAEST